MNFLDDEALVLKVQQGDHDAFALLVKKYLKLSVNFVSKVLQDKALAEDAVSEAFLKLWQKSDYYEVDKGAFKPWFFRLVLNSAYTLRRKKKVYEFLGEDLIAILPSADNQYEVVKANQQTAKMDVVLAKLPQRQREAIVLKYYTQSSDKEGAKTMDISLKAYESLVVRAKQFLRKELKDGDI